MDTMPPQAQAKVPQEPARISLMAIAPETEVSPEAARELLMAISQCLPEVILTSSLQLSVNSPAASAANSKETGIWVGPPEEYRSKLISIAYSQSQEAQPLPSFLEKECCF